MYFGKRMMHQIISEVAYVINPKDGDRERFCESCLDHSFMQTKVPVDLTWAE